MSNQLNSAWLKIAGVGLIGMLVAYNFLPSDLSPASLLTQPQIEAKTEVSPASVEVKTAEPIEPTEPTEPEVRVVERRSVTEDMFEAYQEKEEKLQVSLQMIERLKEQNRQVRADAEALGATSSRVRNAAARSQVNLDSLEAENMSLREQIDQLCRWAELDVSFETSGHAQFCN